MGTKRAKKLDRIYVTGYIKYDFKGAEPKAVWAGHNYKG